MKYEILTADSTYALTERVNIRLANGWVPAGGVAVRNVDSNPKHDNLRGCDTQRTEFYQALFHPNYGQPS